MNLSVAVLTLLAFSQQCTGFGVTSPLRTARSIIQNNNVAASRSITSHRMMTPNFGDLDTVVSSLNSQLLSVDGDDYAELARNVLIVLAFGGGLIPAAIGANKSMFNTITNSRPDPAKAASSKNSLDPYAAKGAASDEFVSASGATGPSLKNSALLFAKDDIPLADIVAIMGRISNIDDIADWKNLPSTKLPNLSNPANPPMLLPRSAFKQGIRAGNFKSWPKDPTTGEPVGGADLEAAEGKRVKQKGALISDAALDAVFDTWAWGASLTTPDKVAPALREFRPDAATFDVDKFAGAAIRGRSVTGIGILTFIVIQTVAYGSLFIAPFLRVFLDIDIGFGQLGACGSGVCHSLF